MESGLHAATQVLLNQMKHLDILTTVFSRYSNLIDDLAHKQVHEVYEKMRNLNESLQTILSDVDVTRASEDAKNLQALGKRIDTNAVEIEKSLGDILEAVHDLLTEEEEMHKLVVKHDEESISHDLPSKASTVQTTATDMYEPVSIKYPSMEDIDNASNTKAQVLNLGTEELLHDALYMVSCYTKHIEQLEHVSAELLKELERLNYMDISDVSREADVLRSTLMEITASSATPSAFGTAVDIIDNILDLFDGVKAQIAQMYSKST